MKGYPRPQFVRESYQCLNGAWDFCFDDLDEGNKLKYYLDFPKQKTIKVPFSYETKASGINELLQHDIVWYHRTFNILKTNKKTILHFGAVDYYCDIYINNMYVDSHSGGNTSFSVDITDYVVFNQENDLVLKVFDPMEDKALPRGKQYWKQASESIFYTKTTGIWQTVWIEQVENTYLDFVHITPNIDTSTVDFSVNLNRAVKATLEITITHKDEFVVQKTVELTDTNCTRTIDLAGYRNLGNALWSPENPNIFSVVFKLIQDGVTIDLVKSYFGYRKISIEGNQIYLNNKPYYLRLALDQGYYPESLLTSKSDSDLIRDIDLAKSMGFNGVRKHQKVEEERYLYYADIKGLLVWGELPSTYIYSIDSRERLKSEWVEVIKRDYNHPSIIVWVPINESWGVPKLLEEKEQVDFLQEMYYLTKSLDKTRLVVSNDGWEHGDTDLFNIHDYESKYDVLIDRYSSLDKLLVSKPGDRTLFNEGFEYNNQPILTTEFGGISYQKNGASGWGYSNATDSLDFEDRLKAVFKAIYNSPLVTGFCYTQLVDVEQEINGLLTYNREPKIDIEKIRKIVMNS